MPVTTVIHLHFSAGDIRHAHRPARDGDPACATLDIGEASLFFRDTAAVDAAIRELAALKTEMLGDAGAQEDARFAADAASLDELEPLPAQAEPDERLHHAASGTRPCRSPQAHGYSATALSSTVQCDVPQHHHAPEGGGA